MLGAFLGAKMPSAFLGAAQILSSGAWSQMASVFLAK
jgi:hypothetical protein